MTMFAGLDVGGKRTAVCILDDAGKIVWRGMADTHPELIDAALRRFKGQLAKVGLESGPSAMATAFRIAGLIMRGSGYSRRAERKPTDCRCDDRTQRPRKSLSRCDPTGASIAPRA